MIPEIDGPGSASQEEAGRQQSRARLRGTWLEPLAVCACLWALPFFVLFLGWGTGTGDVETGQCDCGPSQSSHPLVGTALVWIGVALIVPVTVLTALILLAAVRDRRRN